MSNDYSGEWKVITRADKRRVMRGAGRVPASDVASLPAISWTTENRQLVMQTMSECRAKLPFTDVYRNLISAWSNGGFGAVEQIVCYGIGNLATFPSAPMWQLACALCLREFLEERQQGVISFAFYDPAMTPAESQVLEDWNVMVISENECGKREIHAPTLFFMPHCPLRLYNNVIWANWDEVGKLILFGNSLTAYRDLPRKLPEAAALAYPFVKEEQVNFTSRDRKEMAGNAASAFNDSCLTWFVTDVAPWPARPDESTTTMGSDDEVVP